MKRLKKHLPLLATLAALGAMICASAEASAGAREGLSVCARSLAPSLFPFFVLANLLSALGLADILSGVAGGVMGRLFRVSGAGCQAFFLGITGGYPLGAAAVAQLRREGRVSRREAERLAAFCNNSGPAFILGAVGGVFQSPAAGLLLYVTHILAAIGVGLLFRRGAKAPAAVSAHTAPPPMPFSAAFSASVSKALSSTLAVCGYVVFFSALLGLLTPLSLLPPLYRAAAAGFLELGSGIAALAGLAPTPTSLAVAALMLGWGGLSVQCQTLSVFADTDIKCARHLAGRALCGGLSAVLTYAAALILFQ